MWSKKMIFNYDRVVNNLAADLDNRVSQQKVIASNIANIDTPNYKAKDLKFHRILSDNMDGLQMKRSHALHMTDGSGGIRHNELIESPTPGRPDGNNVNIDDEMLKMTENNIQYNVSVQMLSKQLKKIQEAIAVK